MKYYGKHDAGFSRARQAGWIVAGVVLAALCGAALLKLSEPARARRLPEAKAPVPQKSATVRNAPSSQAAVKKQSGSWELILVNYDHEMPAGYRPKLTTAFGFQMDARIVSPFQAMRSAAAKDGVSLWISSAYRSREYQGELFQQEIKNYQKTYSTRAEAVAFAEKSVAKPGCSEHITGLALDMNGVRDDFVRTPAFRWLQKNAPDYGFILRYPKDKQAVTHIRFEPWHYRYVGVENAKKMQKTGLCLEEYLKDREKTTAVN